MPTRWAAGSGGDGVCRSVSRWGTGGKRGRESLALEGSSEPWKARRVALRSVRVAIARSPLGHLYSPFIRLSTPISPYLRYGVSPVVESAAGGPTENSPLRDRRLYSLFQPKARNVDQVGILIIDDDASSQAAMRQVLGSEGWLVEGASSTAQAFKELASRKWALVLANTGTTGNTGPLFDTLRELAQPPEGEATKAHVRVLFVVPDSGSAEATALLEEDHLPYVVKPFTFHDLLERVSDLLMETEAIGAPLRKVKQEGLKSTRRSRNAGRDPGRDGARNTGMFSNHDYQWSEEELAEYEQQDSEAMRKKKKKPLTLG
jgi:DNA-binding response OmpR family regulator